MRWSYKTVHYDLQKEGLLGNAFLDESAVELSLNEYGMAGWELVSILETQEGLLAVFKQPMSIGRTIPVTEEELNRPRVALRPKPEGETHVAERYIEEEEAEADRRRVVVPVEDYEIVVEDEQAEKRQEGESKNDIGSIRIE